MKKILNEWKIFLKENSRFENDVEVVPKIRPIVERRTNANLYIFFILFLS